MNSNTYISLSSFHPLGGENLGEELDKILAVVRSPRALEALIVIASKLRSGIGATIKDIIEWLGVNDNRARALVSKLSALGVINQQEENLTLTDAGWKVIDYVEKALGIRVGSDIASAIKTVREQHVFYRVRSVARIKVSPHEAFSPSVEPSPKIILQKTLWASLPLTQRFAGAIYIVTDYERVKTSGSLDDSSRVRAERAELSGILRITRLFALSLPPNLLGEPMEVNTLIEDVGSRWAFAESLLKYKGVRYRYLEQVDALYLARFDKQRKALYPLHETGLEAYKWLSKKLDSVLSSIPDFYQPIAVALYSLAYNRALTYDDILEGTNDPILEQVRDEAGKKTYRNVIERVFHRRLLRYRLVELIGPDKFVVPKAIFHRLVLLRGTSLNDIIKSVNQLFEAMPRNMRVILEYIIKNVGITPQDLAQDLHMSTETAISLVRVLSDHGLLIPSTYRYLWVGVAPAKFIEEAIDRDLYIYLFDITRRFDRDLARRGVDLVEVLERLLRSDTIDLFAEAHEDRRVLSKFSKYFFRLEEIGLVEVDEGFIVRPKSDEAKRLLRIFVTTYVLPRGLDIIGEKIIAESNIINTLRKFREVIMDMLHDTISESTEGR